MRISPALTLSLAAAAHGQIYNLQSNWSESFNPNGNWSYRAGSAYLPHVSAWEAAMGSWSSPQPGWAFSANDTNRIPFFFRSNGSENFPHDFLAGDIVVHSQDDANGIGNGPARIVWTSPAIGTVTISGSVWPGRSIGRANHWTLYVNQTPISDGQLDSGGPYSRSSPFLYGAGSGGAAALQNIPVGENTAVILEITRTSQFGDFVGINLELNYNSRCYPDCDHATGVMPCLNVLDFGCFLNRFAAGDPYANCDNSTTPPVLNVLDFSCFLNRFAAGCSAC